MSSVNVLPGLESWDPAPLRKHLLRGGFHSKALEALGMPEKWMRSLVPAAALLGRVAPGTNIDTLLRLFALGECVSGEVALNALGESATGLLELGLLAPNEGSIFSRFQLIPINNGWVACDFVYPRPEIGERGSAGNDYVMGIGPSTILLRTLVPPVRGRVLELACGIAWLSTLLSDAGAEVTSIDLNERALRLAAFQQKLRGTKPIDLRAGDGFEAVKGEKFDLIVSNPPYVQSPGGERVYREGKADESICQRLLTELPDYLSPEGIAVILVNWTHQDADTAFEEGPLSWLPESGLRRWVFQNDCSTPADYAWQWIGQDPVFKGDEATAEMKRWQDFYRSRGIGAISGGFVILQKCELGEEWTRTDTRGVKDLLPTAGSEILQVLENETWLSRCPEDGHLLTFTYSVPDGLCTTAEMSLSDQGWHRQTIRLTSPGRLAYDGQIDENLMRLLELCKSGRPPMDMVLELRATPAFSALDHLEELTAGLVKELVRFGLLIPSRPG